MLQPHDKSRFEHLVLPHLDSAFNLACWLVRNRADGEDVAQEAVLRAYRFFDRFRGDDARAWLLRIVRNTYYTWVETNRSSQLMGHFDEELHQDHGQTPEAVAAQNCERHRLMEALESLPARYREIIVLRELEGCSYKEIAEIVGIPMGTVMSTLCRARARLHSNFTTQAAAKEA